MPIIAYADSLSIFVSKVVFGTSEDMLIFARARNVKSCVRHGRSDLNHNTRLTTASILVFIVAALYGLTMKPVLTPMLFSSRHDHVLDMCFGRHQDEGGLTQAEYMARASKVDVRSVIGLHILVQSEITRP